MGDRATAALFQGQPRLGTIQGLNLAFFIDTQHDGVLGRVQIQADHLG
jgi:hypothetical protein